MTSSSIDCNGGNPMQFLRWAVPLLSCSLLWGQDFRATITGQVSDSAKAAIPNAAVRAIQPDTNQVTQTVTNLDGYYTLAYLPPIDMSWKFLRPDLSRFAAKMWYSLWPARWIYPSRWNWGK